MFVESREKYFASVSKIEEYIVDQRRLESDFILAELFIMCVETDTLQAIFFFKQIFRQVKNIVIPML